VLLLLLAWALRLAPILDHRLHPDEALYGYWGLLIANGRDPWLAAVPAYKPPLLPYVIAGAQALFGNSEFSVRLPGLAASLLTVSLVAALAHSLYRNRRIAAVAAVSVALSPFAIQFSSTAFIDPLMVALGLGACVMAARGRVGWVGVWAGLALAAKQTGLAWVPLALGPSLIENKKARAWARSIGYFLLIMILVFLWDAVRMAQGAESFWRVGAAGYGGLRLIWPHELWARLRGWTGLARYLFVSPAVNTALLVGLPALACRAVARRSHTREMLVDLFLVSFVLVYLLLHWLLAFPIWDRYLLPLVPVLAVLLGRTLDLLLSRAQRAIRLSPFVICHFLLIICLARPALVAAQGRYPIGGYNDADDGIDQVVAFLRDLPEGSVVYQHWLGWQYAYYLFDGPAYLAYWPTPSWLARDVQVFGALDPRYITFPSGESSARVAQALAEVGYGLEPVLAATRQDGTRSFTVYHIQPKTMDNEQ